MFSCKKQHSYEVTLNLRGALTYILKKDTLKKTLHEIGFSMLNENVQSISLDILRMSDIVHVRCKNAKIHTATLWAHTVNYALLQHYDTILLKYYFLIGFVDFYQKKSTKLITK